MPDPKNMDHDPRDDDAPIGGFDTIANDKALVPVRPQQVNIELKYVTAMVVPNPRQTVDVVRRIRELATVGGERFFYAWDVNDKGKKTEISGLSIKGANALVTAYGNCAVEIDVHETDTHYFFKAVFIDLETGANMPRQYRQRKKLNMGRMDADRAEDIAFQIGQSKAIRNAVTNALDIFQQEMLEFARKGIIERIKRNLDGTMKWILATAEKHSVTLKQLELYVVRPQAEWVPQHMAKLYAALQAIEEGMEVAPNVFPAEIPSAKQGLDGTQPDKKAEGDGKAPAAEKTAEPAKQQQQRRQSSKAGKAAESKEEIKGEVGKEAGASEKKEPEQKPADPAKAETKPAEDVDLPSDFEGEGGLG